ncbi:MAG: single-stranded-DNA-specific exonuclease RecJ [Oscillospiraceae bacterium]
MKKWIIGKPDEKTARELSAAGNISTLTAEALMSRGIYMQEQAESFFGKGSDTDELGLYSPYDLPDMQTAADEITAAVDRGDKICIYGDYDCDGILSAAALYNYLSETGADVSYFINKRSDGYGMNIDNVRMLAEQGVQMIITVDNGISAIAEADLCAELGVRLIITDHHTPPPVLPKAAAVVDPHIDSPDNHAHFRQLCGCGVVLKLITAMEYGESGIPVEMMSDFAAIATIGDVMPLTGENRTIVRHGLHYIENTENLGLKALLEAVASSESGKKNNLKINARTIAFTICPRINAAGRMGSAMDAAELFTTDDPERAKELAHRLCELNNLRKNTENDIMKGAEKYFSENPADFDRTVIVSAGKDLHTGVIGIAAAKLCEHTGKPVFIISVNDEGMGVGSARAPEGFSVYDSLFECSGLLTKFGGHKGAGGFSIPEENIPEFRERLCRFAGKAYFEPQLSAVKAISPSELTVDNIERLNSELEPYGEKNPEPVFLLSGCRVLSAKPLSEGKYTRVTVDFGGTGIAFPLFKTAFSDFPYAEGDIINIMAVPKINEFKGNKSVTLDVCDMRINGVNQQKLLNGEKIYRMLKNGILPEDKRVIAAMVPTRENFALVYRAVPEEREVSEEYIFNRLCTQLNLCVLHVILDAFEQTGLISRSRTSGYIRRIKTEKGKKADFNETDIIKFITANL